MQATIRHGWKPHRVRRVSWRHQQRNHEFRLNASATASLCSPWTWPAGTASSGGWRCSLCAETSRWTPTPGAQVFVDGVATELAGLGAGAGRAAPTTGSPPPWRGVTVEKFCQWRKRAWTGLSSSCRSKPRPCSEQRAERGADLRRWSGARRRPHKSDPASGGQRADRGALHGFVAAETVASLRDGSQAIGFSCGRSPRVDRDPRKRPGQHSPWTRPRRGRMCSLSAPCPFARELTACTSRSAPAKSSRTPWRSRRGIRGL